MQLYYFFCQKICVKQQKSSIYCYSYYFHLVNTLHKYQLSWFSNISPSLTTTFILAFTKKIHIFKTYFSDFFDFEVFCHPNLHTFHMERSFVCLPAICYIYIGRIKAIKHVFEVRKRRLTKKILKKFAEVYFFTSNYHEFFSDFLVAYFILQRKNVKYNTLPIALAVSFLNAVL